MKTPIPICGECGTPLDDDGTCPNGCKQMKTFRICYDLSKDGSRRLSQISGDTMTIEAENEQEALAKAKASIESLTNQTVLDIWIPAREDSLPAELRAIYPFEKYGHWGE